MKIKRCPCHSGKEYAACCSPYHEGKEAENALVLMRSRYAAYALGLADYIVRTTHPENPSYTMQQDKWKQGILEFSRQTVFEGLKIVEFVDGEQTASVTFIAGIKQNGHDISFTEKSCFFKVGGHWLYHSGNIS